MLVLATAARQPPGQKTLYGEDQMTSEVWLSDLYQRNYALLYRIGRVFLGSFANQETLIEDQIQETFIRAWQKYSLLQKHPNPDGWLVECFRKCLMNACRKQNREWQRTAFSVDMENTPPVADTKGLSPDDYVRTREQLELLKKLLGEKDADLFIRYCVLGEKAAPSAADLGMSEQALRMRISRLKKKLLANRELFACLVMLCLFGMGGGVS